MSFIYKLFLDLIISVLMLLQWFEHQFGLLSEKRKEKKSKQRMKVKHIDLHAKDGLCHDFIEVTLDVL